MKTVLSNPIYKTAIPLIFCLFICGTTDAQEVSAPLGIFDATVEWKVAPDQADGNLGITKTDGNIQYRLESSGSSETKARYLLYAKRNGSWQLQARMRHPADALRYSMAISGLSIRANPLDASSPSFSLFRSVRFPYKEMGYLHYHIQKQTPPVNHRSIIRNKDEDWLLADTRKPIHFRLTRIEPLDWMGGEYSWDGIHWRRATDTYFAMPDSAAYGLFVTSAERAPKNNITLFDQVQLQPAPLWGRRTIDPESFRSGQLHTVTLHVFNPQTKPRFAALKETFPADWTVKEIDREGIQEGNTLNWAMDFLPGSTHLRYQVQAPNHHMGLYTFMGTIDTAAIWGDSQVGPFYGVHKYSLWRGAMYMMFFTVFPLALFVVHFSLYIFHPRMKEHLFYSLLLLSHACVLFFYQTEHFLHFDLDAVSPIGSLTFYALFFFILFLPRFFHEITHKKALPSFWVLFVLLLIDFILLIREWSWYLYQIFMALFLFAALDCLRVVLFPHQKKIRGYALVVFGALIAICFQSWLLLQELGFARIPTYYMEWGYTVFFISMSVFLAYNYAHAQKNLERLNVELEDRVEERTAALRAAQDQLIQSEKMASLGQLVAGIAHEINNPINFIKSNIPPLKDYLFGYRDTVESLRKQEDRLPEDMHKEFTHLIDKHDLAYAAEDSDKLIQSFEDGSDRIAHIVSDLRLYSRVDREYFSPFNLHEAIDSSLTLLENSYKERIVIHREYGELPLVVCSPGQINQVFLNLLNNAVQAIEGEGHIWIATRQEGTHAIVEIRDDGAGIPEEKQKKIFDPFFTTKPVGMGTGLGLSISYSIIEQHHGTIEVESEAGKGALFRVILPLTHETNQSQSDDGSSS